MWARSKFQGSCIYIIFKKKIRNIYLYEYNMCIFRVSISRPISKSYANIQIPMYELKIVNYLTTFDRIVFLQECAY